MLDDTLFDQIEFGGGGLREMNHSIMDPGIYSSYSDPLHVTSDDLMLMSAPFPITFGGALFQDPLKMYIWQWVSTYPGSFSNLTLSVDELSNPVIPLTGYPQNLSLTASSSPGFATVTWDPYTNEPIDGYRLWWGASEPPSDLTMDVAFGINTANINLSTYNGTPVFINIRAFNSQGDSPVSSSETITLPPSIITIPSYRITSSVPGRVDIGVQELVNGLVAPRTWRIYYSYISGVTTAAPYKEITWSGGLFPWDSFFIDSLNPGETIYIKVHAIGQTGLSYPLSDFPEYSKLVAGGDFGNYQRIGRVVVKHNLSQAPADLFDIEYDATAGKVRFKELLTAAQANAIIMQAPDISYCNWWVRYEDEFGTYTPNPAVDPDGNGARYVLPDATEVNYSYIPDSASPLGSYLLDFASNNPEGSYTPIMSVLSFRTVGTISFTNAAQTITQPDCIRLYADPFSKRVFVDHNDNPADYGFTDSSDLSHIYIEDTSLLFTNLPSSLALTDLTNSEVQESVPLNTNITTLTGPVVSQLVAMAFSEDYDTMLNFTTDTLESPTEPGVIKVMTNGVFLIVSSDGKLVQGE